MFVLKYEHENNSEEDLNSIMGCLLREINSANPWFSNFRHSGHKNNHHLIFWVGYKENSSNSLKPTIYGLFVSCFITSKYYRHISKKTSTNDFSSIIFHLEINTAIIKEDWPKYIVHASKSKTMVKDSVVLGILTTHDEN